MRQLGILLLNLEQFGRTLRRFAGPEQREPVVQALPSGIGRQTERLPELFNCLNLSGRILIERFTEISMLPQPFFERTVGRSGKQHETREQPESLHPRAG